jgi:sterol desaturase/sphingolipid hydroxylase (fatty acid hydroxylase superfamily)
MTGAQIIVLATPVFLALIGAELALGRARGRSGYRLDDALSSIGLGILSQVAAVFTAVVTLGSYVWVYDRFALAALSSTSPWTWLAGLVAYDFLYYWHHRAGHRVALFWAAHVVHHQSEDYNLSTALRQTSSGWLVGWIFYLPMALAGFPPLVFAVVALVDLLYQFWVHTEQVGRLGAFDRWFCAPSNHRVHHAVNDVYLDRNYGGVFLVWDRLFGTYAEEDPAVPCVYGTRAPLRSWNPIRANLQVYADLGRDAWRTARWSDKARVWIKPPGWRPADVAARWPKAPFVVERHERFQPTLSPRRQVLALLVFIAVLAATTLFLWHAHRLDAAAKLAAALAIGTGLWLVGRLCEGAPRRRPAAPIESAAARASPP